MDWIEMEQEDCGKAKEDCEETEEKNAWINTEQKYNLGLKWYKFLIYFSLWAGAILHFITGISVLTGAQYLNEGVQAEMVYDAFPGLKSVDTFYGLILIAFAVYQIVVRFYLARFKAIAPKMLISTYIIAIVCELFYGMVASEIIGQSLMSDIISSLTPSVVMLIINYKYFKNRKECFVN